MSSILSSTSCLFFVVSASFLPCLLFSFEPVLWYLPESAYSSVRLWAEEQTHRNFNSELVLIDWGHELTQPLREEMTSWYLSKLLLVLLWITRKVKQHQSHYPLFLCWLASRRKKRKLYLFLIQFSAFVFSTLLNVKDPFPFRLNFLLYSREMCDSRGAHQTMVSARH